MIKYDYLIERDEGDKTRSFIPKLIPVELPDITYIEGPNSSGKSTLLNIIAAGFYGLKNERINDALKEKIKSLTHSQHQKLKFRVEITNTKLDLQLIAEKKSLESNDILVQEIRNGKNVLLDADHFNKKYNLIYDIPDNPTQRLSQLILDIREAQIRYSHAVGALKETVRRIIGEITKARDPERIKTLQRQIDSNKKDLDLQNKLIQSLEKQLDILECYTYQRFYEDYRKKCDDLTYKISLIDTRVDSERKKAYNQSRTFSKAYDQAKSVINEMQGTFDTTTSLLGLILDRKEKYLLKIWDKIDLNKVLKTFEIIPELGESIANLQTLISCKMDEFEKDTSYKEANLFSELIRVLENYKSLNINLPGIKRSILEFISDLRVEEERFEKANKIRQNTKIVFDYLNQLKLNKIKLEEQILPKLKKLKVENIEEYQDTIEESAEDRKKQLKEQLKEYQGVYEEYDSKYSVKNRPSKEAIIEKSGRFIKDYEHYTEEQLKKSITTQQDMIFEKKAENKNTDHSQIKLSTEIERLKNQEPHKYQNHLKYLNSLFDKLHLMDSKLKTEYYAYIEAIIDKKVEKNTSEDQLRYNETIFNFLAIKLGQFRHIDKQYKAIKVDLIKGIIYTESKKKVHLSDMGTGQSQSAYLNGLLSTSDKRMIIAMFDEVAMMDNASLEPIYDKYRDLYKKGRLLAGIVVQKGEKASIISKVEG